MYYGIPEVSSACVSECQAKISHCVGHSHCTHFAYKYLSILVEGAMPCAWYPKAHNSMILQFLLKIEKSIYNQYYCSY